MYRPYLEQGDSLWRSDWNLSPVGVSLETLEKDPDRDLVTAPGLDGDGAVLGVTGLGAVPAEDGHVGGGDAEEAALGHGLDGGVQEGGRTAVRVEVYHVKPVLLLLVLVHQQGGVTVVARHDVLHLVVSDIPLDALHRLSGQVVGQDGLDTGQLLGEPDGPEATGGQGFKDSHTSLAGLLVLLHPLVNEALYDGGGEISVELLDRVVEHVVEAREENFSSTFLGEQESINIVMTILRGLP